MISYVTTSFKPAGRPLDGRHITANGYRGLLYRSVLKPADTRYFEWMHEHPDPKPFAMVPYFDQNGHLAGLRYTAFNDDCANVLAHSWHMAHDQARELALGEHQKFQVDRVQHIPCADWIDLASQGVGRKMTLEFVAPTLFRKGEGCLPLPMPRNVFMRPMKIWNRYAPEGLAIPDSWLDWVEANVFIQAHNVQTVPVSYNHRTYEVGFVGKVHFEAMGRQPKRNLAIWQSLGHLLPISGTGARTMIGFGAVERID